ncbi:MAG: hypothetical protein ACU0GG_04585 [Paracoccaceae bacterium]
MSDTTSETPTKARHSHANLTPTSVEELSCVPKESALSKVLGGQASDPATVSLALQDLAVIASDKSDQPMSEVGIELIRDGLLTVAQAIEDWSKEDQEDRSVLSKLNSPNDT